MYWVWSLVIIMGAWMDSVSHPILELRSYSLIDASFHYDWIVSWAEVLLIYLIVVSDWLWLTDWVCRGLWQFKAISPQVHNNWTALRKVSKKSKFGFLVYFPSKNTCIQNYCQFLSSIAFSIQKFSHPKLLPFLSMLPFSIQKFLHPKLLPFLSMLPFSISP